MFAAGLTAVGTVGVGIEPNSAYAQSDSRGGRAVRASNRESANRGEQGAGNYVQTAEQALLMTAAKLIGTHVLKKIGIEHSNPVTKEDIKKILTLNPKTILAYVIAYPVGEEAVFRLLPNLFLPKNGKMRWDVGVPVSMLFAAIHNIDDPVEGKWFQKSIPLTQFVGSLFYWYLIRERGFSHSVLAHSINNASVIAVANIMGQMAQAKSSSKEY